MYAVLVERETTWEHILALEDVLLKYGFPLAYYVDSHSIFRFVQSRDSFWRNHYRLTDELNPQWKQVLDDCGVKVTYALSPEGSRGRWKDLIGGYKTDWSGPVIERMSGLFQRAN